MGNKKVVLLCVAQVETSLASGSECEKYTHAERLSKFVAK